MIVENVVYVAIGWLSLSTVIFMFLILNINRIEIINSQRAMNMKLAMHYNHKFHKMRVAFEKYYLFKSEDSKTAQEMIGLFNRHAVQLHESVQVLSDELSMNCVDNRFVFIKSKELRSLMVVKSKTMIDSYHKWVKLLKDFEEASESRRANEQYDETLIMDRFNQINIIYNRMIEQVIEMFNLLSNETYLDVLNII